MSNYYPTSDDVRKRANIYFAPDELTKLDLWAKNVRKRPRSTAVREGLMKLIDAELARYEMHQAITDIACSDMEES